MKRQINELLEMQVIEPSQSHYCCSVMIIRNHAEIVRVKARMVINSGPLNAITYDFKYPLPRIDTILQKI